MTRMAVGLGNPGPEYAWTPHNLGRHVVERVALHEGVLFRPAKDLSELAEARGFSFARLEDPDALLVKPETFMNRSGQVVAALVEGLGMVSEDVLVVVDDIDLDLGQLRIRPHGGAGGHNGMRSIIQALGTDRFPRLRIGVGRPRTDAARYVLEPFSVDRRVEAEISVAEASEAVLAWLLGEGLDQIMTRFHSRWTQVR